MTNMSVLQIHNNRDLHGLVFNLDGNKKLIIPVSVAINVSWQISQSHQFQCRQKFGVHPSARKTAITEKLVQKRVKRQIIWGSMSTCGCIAYSYPFIVRSVCSSHFCLSCCSARNDQITFNMAHPSSPWDSLRQVQGH